MSDEHVLNEFVDKVVSKTIASISTLLVTSVSKNIAIDLNVEKDFVNEPMQSIKVGVNALLETPIMPG